MCLILGHRSAQALAKESSRLGGYPRMYLYAEYAGANKAGIRDSQFSGRTVGVSELPSFGSRLILHPTLACLSLIPALVAERLILAF